MKAGVKSHVSPEPTERSPGQFQGQFIGKASMKALKGLCDVRKNMAASSLKQAPLRSTGHYGQEWCCLRKQPFLYACIIPLRNSAFFLKSQF